MRMFVESLKRLYKQGRVTKEKIAQFVEQGKISEEEYLYITGENYEA